jgi:hypothetical protein
MPTASKPDFGASLFVFFAFRRKELVLGNGGFEKHESRAKPFWFFDKSRDFAIGICHWHPYGAFGNSQAKKENNASFGRFYFPFQLDHDICQRTTIL